MRATEGRKQKLANEILKVIYDLVLLIAGGSIGAVYGVYYSRVVPYGFTEPQLFLATGFLALVFALVLLTVRLLLIQVGKT